MLSRLASLRSLLHEMEQETGLSALSPSQRDLIYAAESVASADGVAALSDLQCHPLLKNMTRPTFFRHLSTLVDQQLLVHIGSERSGLYELAVPQDAHRK